MNLTLKGSELTVFVLHLNIMRKTLKKGFKANYGSLEGKRMIKLYDSIKERLETDLELIEEVNLFTYDLAPEEINMLQQFTTWYVNEIKVSVDTEKDIMTNEQLIVLEEIAKQLTKITEELQEESA